MALQAVGVDGLIERVKNSVQMVSVTLSSILHLNIANVQKAINSFSTVFYQDQLSASFTTLLKALKPC